jgi:hypothetical protein
MILSPAPNPGYDQGKIGRYLAFHAKKKLIAYFIDRHVFLPQDREPNLQLEASIDEVQNLFAAKEHSSVAWAEVCDFEEKQAELRRQLLDTDDLSLGDSYDEQEVRRLKHEIDAIDEMVSTLELHAEVAVMRNQQNEECRLLKKMEVHEELIELSRNEPPFSLKQAVILSSNEICEVFG